MPSTWMHILVHSSLTNMSLVPKKIMVSDSVATRPCYLAALKDDHAILHSLLRNVFFCYFYFLNSNSEMLEKPTHC